MTQLPRSVNNQVQDYVITSHLTNLAGTNKFSGFDSAHADGDV